MSLNTPTAANTPTTSTPDPRMVNAFVVVATASIDFFKSQGMALSSYDAREISRTILSALRDEGYFIKTAKDNKA
jgi:hypothetical protein